MHTPHTSQQHTSPAAGNRTALSESIRVIYASMPPEGDALVPVKHITGQSGVSEAQAKRNRDAGKGPARPRPQIVGIAPMSSPTLYRMIATGRFPKLVSITPQLVGLMASTLRAWLAAQQTNTSTSVSPHKRRAGKA